MVLVLVLVLVLVSGSDPTLPSKACGAVKAGAASMFGLELS
jgi:hypothetical protein